MYQIVTVPNKILIEKSKSVISFDVKLENIITKMTEALLATTDPVGVGLAAPQVGLPLRIFQMRPKENGPITSYINPEIIDISEGENIPIMSNSQKVERMKKLAEKGGPKAKKGQLLEGCLSVPNIWGHVTRKKDITISWQDVKGKKHKKRFIGFPAIIVQHETDHLNGVLFTKHVLEQKEKLYKSHKDDKGEDVFDEIKI